MENYKYIYNFNKCKIRMEGKRKVFLGKFFLSEKNRKFFSFWGPKNRQFLSIMKAKFHGIYHLIPYTMCKTKLTY